MYVEKYGDENLLPVVFLHGANFVHSFGRQYVLSDRFHLMVPHIMGYGREAHHVFETQVAADELAQFIRGLNRRVNLVGFSLGAQLGTKLIADHPNLFRRAILVSPWLIKEEPELSHVKTMNRRQLESLKKPWLCNIIGFMNGLPREKRREFVRDMQAVSFQTGDNMVDNGITLRSISGFRDASFPMCAMAGAKEQQSVLDSVRALGAMNPRCQVDLVQRAKHNIPPVFWRYFNQKMSDFLDEGA